MASNGRMNRIGKSECEGMWKEAMEQFSWKENHKNIGENNRSPGRDLNPGPPECEVGVRMLRKDGESCIIRIFVTCAARATGNVIGMMKSRIE
jgi:hypothetical protein